MLHLWLYPLPEDAEEEVPDEQVEALDLSVGVKRRRPTVEDDIHEIEDGIRGLRATGDDTFSSFPSEHSWLRNEDEEDLDLSGSPERQIKPVR